MNASASADAHTVNIVFFFLSIVMTAALILFPLGFFRAAPQA